MSRRPIGSAIGRMISVFDRQSEARAAVDALVAAGFDPAGIELFEGPDDAAAFDASGRRRGLPGRLIRIVEFSLTDQTPDFAWYEAAIGEGRVVLSVRVRGRGRLGAATDILLANSGHFINRFGWFETQEMARWRGPEPKLPDFLRR